MSKKTTTPKAPAKTHVKPASVTIEDKTPAVVEPAVAEALDVLSGTALDPSVAPSIPEIKTPTPISAELLEKEDLYAQAVVKNIDNPEKKVLFLSRNKELNTTIHAGGVEYSPTWDNSSQLLIWYVDKHNAEYFANHTLVKFGKIVRALEK